MTKNSTIAKRLGSAVITLPSDTSYLITRAFDAPAELVFKATTTPELSGCVPVTRPTPPSSRQRAQVRGGGPPTKPFRAFSLRSGQG